MERLLFKRQPHQTDAFKKKKTGDATNSFQNKEDTAHKNRVCPTGLLFCSAERSPNLPPPATQADFVPFFSLFHSICVSSFFLSFPPLILRWLDLICMHLHNESHLHAQGQTVP